MKKTKILIIVVTVILLTLTIIVNWQYDNIKALYYSYKYSNDDIEKLIQNHYNEIDKYLKDNSQYNVRSSTKLEEKLHGSELITDNEFIDLLTGKTTLKNLFGEDIKLNESEKIVKSDGTVISTEELKSVKDEIILKQNGEPQTSGTGTASSTVDESAGATGQESNGTSQSTNDKVAGYIAKMYVLKSSFESQLDGIYVDAKAYYVGLTPEQRKGSKSELFKSFYNNATALESSCDAEVSTLLSELETTLTAAGESTELVSKIQTAYTEEKSLKKAYYINLYNS